MKKEINKETLQKAATVLTKMGVDARKFMDPNDLKDLELNAPMYTGGSGSGDELVNDTFIAEVMDCIPNYGTFLNALPGNHGTGLQAVEVLPIIGDVGKFQLGTEVSSGAMVHGAGTHTLGTDKVTLTQKKLVMQIDVTDELSTFNPLRADAFEQKIREKIAKAMVRTVEHVIINGDTTNSATGNVNLDDADPTDTEAYLGFVGLRKTAFSESTTNDVGTLDIDDFVTVENDLGDYFSDPSECFWIFNRRTYNKANSLDTFRDASKSGRESTIHGKAITNIDGADLFINRDMVLTEADGKSSTTGSNNTKGQFLLFWGPAVQFGFGKDLQVKLFDYGSRGYILDAWFYFAFSIVTSAAGVTDATVASAINVTV